MLPPTLLLAPPLSGFSDLPTVLNHRCIFLPLRYVESSFVVVCHLVWFDRQQLFFQNKKLYTTYTNLSINFDNLRIISFSTIDAFFLPLRYMYSCMYGYAISNN